jgi:DNA recombination protein RmuC
MHACEQAHLIQGEVVRLMEDIGRLDERVRKLQTHFGQASRDIDDILVSSNKVTKRGQKIEALEFGGDEAAISEGADEATRTSTRRVADSKTGQLRLRVVEGDE